MSGSPELYAKLAETSALIISAFEQEFSKRDMPQRLADALRHATLNGGKRVRPFLVLESASLFGISQEQAMPAALSLEALHCYSLVHDDLPAMDDDDMRRGCPSVHKAFDEATAILAGDALLTLAFEILSEASLDASMQVKLMRKLSKAAGGSGMVAGQMLDLAAEGRYSAEKKPLALDQASISNLQGRKTGALITYAAQAGAILGGASEQQTSALKFYGQNLGALFQLADDLIDATGDAALAGKAVLKDQDVGKATLVQLLGIDGARAKLVDLSNEAKAVLQGFGPEADLLRALPDYIGAQTTS